jgi:MoxR-like ATPase
MNTPLTEQEAVAAHQLLEQTLYEMKRVVVGQAHLLERLLLAVMCGGHVLVEGAPGLAKTLALKTLSQVLQLSFQRIQFTPDLLPADLTGTRIYNPLQGIFSTEKGPIFAHFVLADEINRAPAKVQSALLEAMQERQVTIGHDSFLLDAPFLVMATQNPIESDGTYNLPEAQLDRFLFKLPVVYPSHDEELLILERVAHEGLPVPNVVLLAEQVIGLSAQVPRIFLDSPLLTMIVELVQSTRLPGHGIRYGSSPRGTLAIALASKGLALLKGRTYVTPQDIASVYMDCLRHRLILSYESLVEGQTTDMILTRLATPLLSPLLAGTFT